MAFQQKGSEMKYLAILTFSLLLCGVAAPAAADVLVPQEGPALNDYYIGVHNPDGTCQTIEVFADTLDDAMRIIKEQRCSSCVLTDQTATMKSGDPSLIASATRFCPMR